MKKRILLAVIAIATLASCNNNEITKEEIKTSTKTSIITNLSTSIVVKTCNITYDLQGGENDINNKDTVNVNEELIINNPTRLGFSFDGWDLYVDEELVKSYEKDIVLTPQKEENYTLIANWERVAYTVTFNFNKDISLITNYSELPKEVEIRYNDIGYILPKPESSDGDVFDGWYYEDKLVSGPWPYYYDVCLNAKWKS